MRWCLHILSVLILLTFGLELCALASGSAVLKATSHLVLALDEDDVELKISGLRDHADSEWDPFMLNRMDLMAHCVRTELVLSLEKAAISKACPGVRRHRLLCRECC